MVDRFGLLAALSILAAMAAVVPARVEAMPTASAVAAPQRSESVLDVANRRRPYQNVDPRSDRGNDTGDAQVEQLNQMSLQRAQQGQNAPGIGPDTTPELNRMSEQEAARGRNTGARPLMPFR